MKPVQYQDKMYLTESIMFLCTNCSGFAMGSPSIHTTPMPKTPGFDLPCTNDFASIWSRIPVTDPETALPYGQARANCFQSITIATWSHSVHSLLAQVSL